MSPFLTQLSQLEWKVVLPIVLSAIALTTSWIQLSLLRRQMRLDALIKILQSNRELLVLGFEKPALWQFLNPAPTDLMDKAAQEERRRYFQLWVNHVHIIWKAHRTGLFDRSHWNAAKNDLARFLKLQPLQQHWEFVKDCYPRKFQRDIAKLIAAPPPED